MVLAVVACRLASPSGPSSLYQDRSMRWEAMFWPPVRRVFVLDRCVSGLKYPKEIEKL